MIKTNMHRVLVPVSLDEQGLSAIQRAKEIHEKFHANITLLYVVPDESILTEWFRPVKKQTKLLQYRRQFKDFVVKQFGGKFPRFIRLKVRHGSLAKMIVRISDHFRYDLIILNKQIGADSRSTSAWESAIKFVVGESRCPVLTYNGGTNAFDVRTILLPVDIMQPHQQKVIWVSRLAKAWKAKVHVVSALTLNIKEEDSSVFRKMKDIEIKLENEGIDTKLTLLREESGTKLCDIMRDFINHEKPDMTLVMTHQENILDLNYIGRLASELILNTNAPVFCITPKKKTLL